MSFGKIAVWGAGAIGGTIGSYLIRAGHDVLFVDSDEAHVNAIRRNGLTIETSAEMFTVEAEAKTPQEINAPLHTVLLAVKAPVTKDALSDIEPRLDSRGQVVSLQNGLNELLIRDVLGQHRTIGCLVNFGAEYACPGRIVYGAPGALVIGELDGQLTQRLYDLGAVLRAFEPNVEISKDIFGYLWGKLAFIGVLIGQTLANMPTEAFLDDQSYRPVIVKLVREIAQVAAACGIRPRPFQSFDASVFLGEDKELMNRSIDAYADSRRGSKKTYSGIWTDIAVRKRPTEIPYQFGPVLDQAMRCGIDVPYLRRALALLEAVESGKRGLEANLLSLVDKP